MSEELKLLSCPHCGDSSIYVCINAFIHVYCSDCKAASGFFEGKEEAIAAWNRRADAPKTSEGEQ